MTLSTLCNEVRTQNFHSFQFTSYSASLCIKSISYQQTVIFNILFQLGSHFATHSWYFHFLLFVKKINTYFFVIEDTNYNYTWKSLALLYSLFSLSCFLSFNPSRVDVLKNVFLFLKINSGVLPWFWYLTILFYLFKIFRLIMAYLPWIYILIKFLICFIKFLLLDNLYFIGGKKTVFISFSFRKYMALFFLSFRSRINLNVHFRYASLYRETLNDKCLIFIYHISIFVTHKRSALI